MIKKIFFVILALVVIGAIVPDTSKGNSANTTQDSESTAKKEEAVLEAENKEAEDSRNELAESDNNADINEDAQAIEGQEPEEVPRDSTVYSKDDLANEIILRYNEQNPDNKVEPEMVENWLTGGYDQATEIYIGDYQISFGYADATPTYRIHSYKDKSKENREEFIETAIIWIRAIHGFPEDTLNSIADSFLNNEDPDIFSVKVGYNKYKYISYETRPPIWDRYKDATYWIFCYEDY